MIIDKIKLYICVLVSVLLLGLKINDDYNDFKIFKVVKEYTSKEIDIIKVSKRFFGKFNSLFFLNDDKVVVNTDEKYLLNDGSYYVKSSEPFLLSPTSGVVTKITRENGLYNVKIETEYYDIVYKKIKEVSVKLYQNVDCEEEIGLLDFDYNFYYVVSYED